MEIGFIRMGLDRFELTLNPPTGSSNACGRNDCTVSSTPTHPGGEET